MVKSRKKENPEDFILKLSKDSKVKQASFFDELEKLSDKKEKSLEDKENDDIIKMRREWSRAVLFFIGLIILFDFIIVYFYGSGKWTFDDPNVVIVIVSENFLKIIGLGFIITRNIFKKIFGSEKNFK